MSTLIYSGEFQSQIFEDTDERDYVSTHEIRIHSGYYKGRQSGGSDVVYIQMFRDRTKPGKGGIGEIYQIAVPLDQIEEIIVALQFAALHAQKKGDIS